jgi:hypothetical protein
LNVPVHLILIQTFFRILRSGGVLNSQISFCSLRWIEHVSSVLKPLVDILREV